MALTAYVTLDAVKTELGIPLDDTQDDSLLTYALNATTTKINDKTGRPGNPGFNRDAVASPRIYRATNPSLLVVHDIATASGVSVSAGTVAQGFNDLITSDNWELQPVNATADGLPFDAIWHHWAFWPTWPSVRLQVTAVWGWPSVPDSVAEAQLIWCAKIFRRKDSLDGVAGVNDFGPIRIGKMDPDVADMLSDYTRPGFA